MFQVLSPSVLILSGKPTWNEMGPREQQSAVLSQSSQHCHLLCDEREKSHP